MHNTISKPPIFSDSDNDKTLRFLKDFKLYLDNFNLENTTDLIFNLQKSLTGKAKTWLYMIQDQIQTFEDFETEFKNSFWNESIQNNLK